MKLTHKLCGAALLAVIGLSVALPTVTKADVKDPWENGDSSPLPAAGMDIQFTKPSGPGDTTVPTTNPSGSEVIIDSGLVTTDAGTFGMKAATPLKFGEDNSSASGKGRHFFAQNFVGRDMSKDEPVTTENFITFVDDRSTADHQYNITAQITEQFHVMYEGQDRALTGATLNFLNGKLENTDMPGSPLTPTAAVSTDAVNEKAPVKILTNAEQDKGRGNYKISFGDMNTAEEAQKSTKSVKLNILDETELFTGKDVKYKGEITWNMVVGP